MQTSCRIRAVGRRSRWRRSAAKGDGEDEEWDFRHPGDDELPRWCGLTEEVEIAAAHEVETGSHQTNAAVPDIMCLPGRPGRNARCTEQGPRDLSICCAGEVTVERLQRKREPSALMRGQTIGSTLTHSVRSKPSQANCRLNSRGEACVERNDDRCWRVGARPVHEYGGQSILDTVEKQVLALGGDTPECWGEVADADRIDKHRWRRRDDNGRRIKSWQPYR